MVQCVVTSKQRTQSENLKNRCQIDCIEANLTLGALFQPF